MRQTHLFTKTRKEHPKDETTKNAQLLVRGGFVHKEMAGSYSYLPLGIRVLNNIERIVREEMDAVGGQEIKMATLHPSEPWKTTGAWDRVDVIFKINSRTEKEYTIGQSAEEIVTPIAQEYINSYKDLPKAIYQIGQKYRDELRAKSGIMRGREFSMKDMYSFHESQEDFEAFYARVKDAYLRVYARCGLTAKATEASGGSFTEKVSYEFMVLTDAGEDDILYCSDCSYCVNTEISQQKEADRCTRCSSGALHRAKASEVGNIFDLSSKYPKDFGFTYTARDGTQKYPVMGCYGIGITRLMGVIAEALSDEKGLVWPATVAPFSVHLVSLHGTDEGVRKEAERLYEVLQKNNVSVLYDDRDETNGVKLKDADLIGIPVRFVVSAKTLAAGQIESTNRKTGTVTLVNEADVLQSLASLIH